MRLPSYPLFLRGVNRTEHKRRAAGGKLFLPTPLFFKGVQRKKGELLFYRKPDPRGFRKIHM